MLESLISSLMLQLTSSSLTNDIDSWRALKGFLFAAAEDLFAEDVFNLFFGQTNPSENANYDYFTNY